MTVYGNNHHQNTAMKKAVYIHIQMYVTKVKLLAHRTPVHKTHSYTHAITKFFLLTINKRKWIVRKQLYLCRICPSRLQITAANCVLGSDRFLHVKPKRHFKPQIVTANFFYGVHAIYTAMTMRQGRGATGDVSVFVKRPSSSHTTTAADCRRPETFTQTSISSCDYFRQTSLLILFLPVLSSTVAVPLSRLQPSLPLAPSSPCVKDV
jgi:hypothetical protein